MIRNSGIILLDKPKGISSRKALDVIIRRANLHKAGHAGTIDPAASGLLVILSGKATKLNRFILSADKLYRFSVLFGKKTETDDSEGKIISEKDPGKMDISFFEEILKLFRGSITQKPPIHSAVKVNGKRAYKLARKGCEPDLKVRSVCIRSLSVRDFRWPLVEMEALVSSGTYIRSLARDIGEKTGVGAYCQDIRRISIGNMNVDDAISLDGEIKFFPFEKALSHLPCINDDFTEKDFLELTDETCKYAIVMDTEGALSAILERDGGVLKINKIFL